MGFQYTSKIRCHTVLTPTNVSALNTDEYKHVYIHILENADMNIIIEIIYSNTSKQGCLVAYRRPTVHRYICKRFKSYDHVFLHMGSHKLSTKAVYGRCQRSKYVSAFFCLAIRNLVLEYCEACLQNREASQIRIKDRRLPRFQRVPLQQVKRKICTL